jgi:HK97 family phage major capsid protein
MPTYTDLSEANGWIPEPGTNQALLRDVVTSTVEAVARKVTMTSRTVSVPRFASQGVDVVPEHATIPILDATLDEVVLTAIKFADRFAISIEDREDAVVDALNAFKSEWLSNYAIKLDNACLGVTAAPNGTTVPFDSVYHSVGAGRRLATGGALTFEDLVDVFGDMETNRKGGLSVIAHPAFQMSLRNLKDADGLRVVDPTGVLGGGVPTIFGHPVYFSFGARTNATASDQPTGNPLMVVANNNGLILGVRSGPESQLSEEAQWDTDHVELKMRSRRGFVLADANSARVVELTAGA